MAAIRTQIYLTPEQRRRLDELAASQDRALADLIREAVDRFLGVGAERRQREVLDASFGALPDLTAPGRGDWAERERRLGR